MSDNQRGAPGECQVINAPQTLRTKVGPPRHGERAEMEGRASMAMAIESERLGDFAREELDRLGKIIEEAKAGGEVSPRTMLFPALELKGLGAVFGYPWITEVADTFCGWLGKREVLDQRGLAVAIAHYDAMRLIFAQKIEDPDDETGAQLHTELKALVARLA